MTLLAPLKHITALKFSKLSPHHIFASVASSLEPRPLPIPIVHEPAPLPPTPSEILQEIGGELRQLRQQRQLTIEDLSARTRIQPRLIQAIEEGHLEMLPEPVYVRGLVKRYSDSLGLNGLTISARVPHWAPEAATFEPTTKLQLTGFNPTIRINPLQIYIGYTLAIVCAGAVTSYLLNNAIKPPAIASNVIPPRAAGIAVVRPTNSQPAQKLADVKIGIAIQSPTWAQIGIDGTTKFTGNLQPGMQLSWIATKQVTVNTNNAGGLLLSRDGQPAQPLGKVGQKLSTTVKVSK
ncbi:RodZ domain-containing protein [Chamaesiphon sp. OTE_75_metabat_556]|uniref:helix-turn-helix domain-containing protein n=1 Tax=Chamaesiphon sp. OTE_75_metabat_556 TaxID=2964692 RepID=UPI00286B4F37|nr:RodZ domain-containing protein [Chamaesiphon sp. OTE_75_metabat_556]